MLSLLCGWHIESEIEAGHMGLTVDGQQKNSYAIQSVKIWPLADNRKTSHLRGRLMMLRHCNLPLFSMFQKKILDFYITNFQNRSFHP